MNAPANPGREGLYPEAPTVSRQQVADQYAAWRAGQTVTSEVVRSGLILSSEEDLALLNDPAVHDKEYGIVKRDDPLFGRIVGLRNKLLKVVEADMARTKLRGRMHMLTVAGMYNPATDVAQPLHVDGFTIPSMRWTVSHGVKGTRGANGAVCPDDIEPFGNHRLRAEVLVGDSEDCRLEPFQSEENEVTRFSNCAGVHGGPDDAGARVLTTATLHIE